RVKITLDHSSNRLVPSTVPSHAAAGATSICAAENTVVSQEPSSKPKPIAPRMSASAKVVIRVLSVALKAPMRTAATPITGDLQAEDRAGIAPESAAIGGPACAARTRAAGISAPARRGRSGAPQDTTWPR